MIPSQPVLHLVAQEETAILVVGNDWAMLRFSFREVLEGRWPVAQEIELWDGHAAEISARELNAWVADHA